MPDVDWLAERLSADMLDRWRRFEETFGPITIHERLDYLFAVTLARGTGKRISEFMPHWGESQADAIAARLSEMAKR